MPPTELAKALGLTIRINRTRRGWSQRELAQAARMDPKHVSMIENGLRDVGLSTQERIAAALGMPLARLLAEAEEELARSRRLLEGREES